MKKRLSALFLALVLGLSISVPAFAYDVSVSDKTRVDNCRIWSELYRNGSRYNALTFVQADSGNIPANGVKVQAILYDELGEVKASGQSMLTAAYPSHVADTQYRYIRESPAYSQGWVYFRDSSGGYPGHQTQKASESSMSRSASTKEIAAIRTTVSGKTYGSLLLAQTVDECPDLIAATGTEGQSGYVRREDFLVPDDRCGDPDYSNKHIPLYDLSGQVIGTFNITFSHPDTAGKDLETIKSQLAAGSQEDQKLWAIADKVLVNGSYPVNAKGQSYGPHFLRELVGYSPDLSPAVSDDGIAGYVQCRKEIPISAEGMAVLSTATSETLYDVDGNVIGTCKFATPTPVETIGRSLDAVRAEIGNWPANEVSSEAVEASDEIQPRDAVLFYRQNVTSTDGNVTASIELGVDTRKNEIIDIHRLLGIERVNSDYYTTQLSGAEIISERYSLDRTSVEFRIQFYAKTANDPVVGLHYANFETSI